MLEGTAAYDSETVLPNGAVELIINLGSPHKVVDTTDGIRATVFRESWIAGMQQASLTILGAAALAKRVTSASAQTLKHGSLISRKW